MCLLVAVRTSVSGYSLLLAANREERYDRPAAAPAVVRNDPLVAAGQDLEADGTWLGVNEHGLVAALANRPMKRPNAGCRSRGLLCLDVLSCTDAKSALMEAESLCSGEQYNHFNLLVADSSSGWIVTHDGSRTTMPCKEITVLTNSAPDDTEHPIVRKALRMLSNFNPPSLADALEEMQRICRSSEMKGKGVGTRSSSIVAVGVEVPTVYLHCDGFPSEGEYQDFSQLLE